MIHTCYPITPIDSSPLTAEQLTRWLRVDPDEDSDDLFRMMRAAMELLESPEYADQPLFRRSFATEFDGFPCGRLPGVKPVVTSITYATPDVTSQTLTLSDPPAYNDPFRLRPNGLLEFNRDTVGSIAGARTKVVFEAGYDPGDIPQSLLDAILLYISDRYDNRGNGLAERTTAMQHIARQFRVY